MRPIIDNPLDATEVRSASYIKARETFDTEKRRTIAELCRASPALLKKSLKARRLASDRLYALQINDECAQADYRRRKPVLDAEEAAILWLLQNADSEAARRLRRPRTTLDMLKDQRAGALEIAEHCKAGRIKFAAELCKSEGFSVWPEPKAAHFKDWAAFIDGLISEREAQEGDYNG